MLCSVFQASWVGALHCQACLIESHVQLFTEQNYDQSESKSTCNAALSRPRNEIPNLPVNEKVNPQITLRVKTKIAPFKPK